MSSSSHSQSSQPIVYCKCLERTTILTSKTSSNPGKKFYGCKNWNNGGCTFFRWCENQSTTQSQVSSDSILELERKFSLIEEQKTSMAELQRKMVELQRKLVVLEAELQSLKKVNNAHLSSTMKKLRCLEFIVVITWFIGFIGVVVIRL
ncbi:lissencephaly-1 homolog [Striga asiatica]|uniref:Lissencephaly-1 homolog n=1 Tax=Striga asiatica TaxID=4170 RepID=A0A5A7PP92_STRAF|nr:lissencephaly-1 homolog [Striga asiatica]